MDISIVISPFNKNVRIQITETIKREFGEVSIKDIDELQNEYIVWKHKNENEQNYSILFRDEFERWADCIIEEVRWTEKEVMQTGGLYHQGLLSRIDNTLVPMARGKHGEIIYQYLHKDAVLMDIGSSSSPAYGNILPDNVRIQSYAVDALATFYNKLYEKYIPECNRQIKLGIFEFIASFFEKNFANVILIENALDHSIDPVKGILECLEVLKPNGLLRLFHRRCEAIFEEYTGMHHWNIDYNDALELLIWNDKFYINVSKLLDNDVEIKIIPVSCEKRIDQYFVVEMLKEESYDYRKYIDLENENRELSYVLSIIMEKWAETLNY